MREFDYESIKQNGLKLATADKDFNGRRAKISLWIKEIQQLTKKYFIEDEYIKGIEQIHIKIEDEINDKVGKYNEQVKKEGPFNLNFYGSSDSDKILDELNRLLNHQVFKVLEICATIDANSERKKVSIKQNTTNATTKLSENVFIVHGHNSEIKQSVARTVTKLKFNPIILHENANNGNTIIEKLEELANSASYAIILLTDDDLGKAKEEANYNFRARQNVIMELGYFLGKLGRNKVFVLKFGDIEVPSDIIGVVYNTYDGEEGGWRNKLVKDMKSAGFNVDANDLL
ncbi:MAG: nucleotide-binding protein [Clostridiales bacterium]|nr:nucleotide-binding protein [Clostridiales bacterium]